MQFGLENKDIERICFVLSSVKEVEKAIVYGSRAKGNFKPFSDIDLTLIGEGLDLDVLNKITWQLDDLLLPYKIDLSIYSHISNEDLKEHIQRVGEVLFERK